VYQVTCKIQLRLYAVLMALACALAATVASAAPVKLTFSFWATGTEQEINEALVARFNELNPDIQVEAMQIGGNYEEKIKVMTAAGTAPDILFMNPAAASSMYQQGALANMKPYFDRDPRFADKGQYVLFSVPDLAAFDFMYQTDDALFMLPTRYNSFGTYYNIDFFEEAGLPLPGADFTWNAFLNAARKLVRFDADKVVRGGTQSLGTWQTFIQAWVTSNDGRIMDTFNNPKKSTLSEPRTLEALNFVQGIMARERVMGGTFSAGTAAMYLNGFWSIETYRNRDLPFRWGVAPWPYNTKRTTVILIAGYSISSLCKHKDAAWRFVSWMLSPEAEKLAYSRTAVWNPDLFEQARPGSYYYQLPGLPENYQYRVELVNVRPGEWTGPKATDLAAVWSKVFANFGSGTEAVENIAASGDAVMTALLNSD
jgi:multiple sugar transport system substrate-binding protein